MRSRFVRVSINLDRIRASAERIRKQCGVAVIAIVKADAYGLGAERVADAIDSVVDEFGYFLIDEARKVGRRGIVLGPPVADASDYRDLGVRPAVATLRDAERFSGLPVAINLDTGMQRFGCSPDDFAGLAARCEVVDVFTHSLDASSAAQLQEVCGTMGYRLHAAATSLLDVKEALLDAVRPGLALYRGAVTVTGQLHSVRETHGAIGYSRFERPRVGTLLAGYSNGLRVGPIVINGRQQHLLEVGMNASFVSVDTQDKPGDEVTLLGEGLTEIELANHFATREHEILCRYTSMGPREYI